jgi:predicted transcriptional regulator of viral defense system
MDWADRVVVHASQQNGLVTTAQCAAVGISPDQIKRFCRTGVWRPVLRGVYQVWDFGRTHEIRAALLATGPEAVAVSASAAQLLGLPIESKTVHVAVPGTLAVPRKVHGGAVVVHQREIPSYAITTVDGMRVTDPLWTVTDVLLDHNRYRSVPAVDAALHGGLVCAEDLAAVEALLWRRRGAVHAREALDLVDGRAESPLESRGRLRCVDANLKPDALQAEIHAPDGRFVGRVDLLWSSRRLIAEADGAQFHDQPDALFRDRARQNELIAAGYAVIRFTWEDTLSPGRIPAMVRAALSRRR